MEISSTHAVARDLRQQALRCIGRARYEDAFPLYRQLLFDCNDQSSDVLSEAGFVCWQLGAIDEAEECFSRALRADPRHAASLINFVDMRLSLGQADDKTVDLLERLLAYHPEDLQARLLGAKLAFLSGRREEARDLTIRLAEENVLHQMTQLLASKLLLSNGCLRDALALAEQNLQRGDSHPHFYDYAARACAELGQHDQAIVFYDLMGQRHPDRIKPLCGLAFVKFVCGEYSSARQVLEGALRHAPEHAEASHLYFATLVALNDWERLIEATAPFLSSDLPPLLPLIFHIAALGNLGRRSDVERLYQRFGERAKQPLPSVR